MTISDSTRNELLGRFAKLTSNPKFWLMSARRLYAAAGILAVQIQQCWAAHDPRQQAYSEVTRSTFEVTDLSPGYMMLVGFALENQFKAFLVRANSLEYQKVVAKTGRLPKALRTHDLRELAGLCDIDLDEDIGPKLDRLTKFSRWRGRYQFPLDFRTFYHLDSGNDIPSSGVAFTSTDVANISSLVELISEKTGVELAQRATA
jgi:hypothetical protein